MVDERTHDPAAELLAQITPRWLTEVLRTNGHLPQGEVSAIAADELMETPPSIHATLSVTYTSGAPSSTPTRLRLKQPKPHKIHRARRENRFYTEVAPLTPAIPLVPCFGAGSMPGSDTPYLLLGDVSASHTIAERAAPRSQLAAMVEALAQLHASWWDHPQLLEAAGEIPEECFAADFEGDDKRYAELIELFASEVTAEQQLMLERYLANAPRILLERVRSRHALTLCRPDNHYGNFLLPLQPGGPVYIIDWHGYQCWWGPSDIVALTHRASAYGSQYGGHDRRIELLREYHGALVRHGVAGYSWQSCVEDYRLGIIEQLSLVLNARHYPTTMRRLLLSITEDFKALGCDDLLR